MYLNFRKERKKSILVTLCLLFAFAVFGSYSYAYAYTELMAMPPTCCDECDRFDGKRMSSPRSNIRRMPDSSYSDVILTIKALSVFALILASLGASDFVHDIRDIGVVNF